MAAKVWLRRSAGVFGTNASAGAAYRLFKPAFENFEISDLTRDRLQKFLDGKARTGDWNLSGTDAVVTLTTEKSAADFGVLFRPSCLVSVLYLISG